jgi:hypothetical protein
METHPVADRYIGDVRSRLLDYASDFVAQRQWVADGCHAGPVVDVGVADAGGLDTHQNISRANRGNWDLTHLHPAARFD